MSYGYVMTTVTGVRQILTANANFSNAQHLVPVDGMSSPRVCNLLNRLVGQMDHGQAYLEVGTWKGLTLLSAARGNAGRVCVACDKFRLWGRFTGWGRAARNAFFDNLKQFNGPSDATVVFYEMRSEKMFARTLAPYNVGVYFFDGDHSYDGTFDGIVSAIPFLAPTATILVDDWNDPMIRDATHAALNSADVRTLWSEELAGSRDGTGWWNGLGVFAVERSPPVGS